MILFDCYASEIDLLFYYNYFKTLVINGIGQQRINYQPSLPFYRFSDKLQANGKVIGL